MLTRLKEMLLEFILITTGITFAATTFCTIFCQDVQFGIGFLWQIIALSFFCTLPGLVFFTKKELTKKQMLTRKLIHVCLLFIILIFFAYHWKWIDVGSIIQLVVFVIIIPVVYSMVWYFTYQRDKKVANMLNEKLATYKQNKMD